MTTVIQFVIILAIVVVYFYLLIRLKHKVSTLRDKILIPATMILGFVVYYWGYSTIPGNVDGAVVNAIRSIFTVTKLVVLRSDIVGINQALRSDVVYMTLFAAAHAVAILLVATAALSLFGRKLNTIIQLYLSHGGQSYIFFDLNDEALALALDLLRNDPKRLVVFVDNYISDKSAIERIENTGAFYLANVKKDRFAREALKHHIIHKRTTMFYISDDEDNNINSVLQLFSELRTLTKSNLDLAEQNINLCVRLESEDMGQLFEEARSGKELRYFYDADLAGVEPLNISYSLFNNADIIATQFIHNYPPVGYVDIDTEQGVVRDDYEVLIIGFGRNGRNILRKTIEYGQFVGSTYRATVVDSAINQKLGSFYAKYPALKSNYNIEAYNYYVGSTTLFDLLKERCDTLKQIVVALKDDAQNIECAIDVNKMLLSLGRSDIEIIVVTRRTDGYSYIHHSSNFRNIHCIGQDKDIFTENIIVNESLKAQAMATHNFYNDRKPQDEQQRWNELENIKQQSNISAANHISTKLALMGLSIDDIQAMESEQVYLEEVKRNKQRYDNLAQCEHLRWNAAYFTRGWQRWELERIPSSNTKGQDHGIKRHCCLVGWQELNLIDAYFGNPAGTYQSYDYDPVNNIYTLVKNNIIK